MGWINITDANNRIPPGEKDSTRGTECLDELCLKYRSGKETDPNITFLGTNAWEFGENGQWEAFGNNLDSQKFNDKGELVASGIYSGRQILTDSTLLSPEHIISFVYWYACGYHANHGATAAMEVVFGTYFGISRAEMVQKTIKWIGSAKLSGGTHGTDDRSIGFEPYFGGGTMKEEIKTAMTNLMLGGNVSDAARKNWSFYLTVNNTDSYFMRGMSCIILHFLGFLALFYHLQH